MTCNSGTIVHEVNASGSCPSCGARLGDLHQSGPMFTSQDGPDDRNERIQPRRRWDCRIFSQPRACQVAELSKNVVKEWRKRGLLDGMGERINGRWRYSAREMLVLAMLGLTPHLNRGLAKRIAAFKEAASKAEQVLEHSVLMHSAAFANNSSADLNLIISADAAAEEMQRRRVLVALFVPIGKLAERIKGKISA